VPKNDFLNALNAFVVDLKVRRASQIGSELGLDGVPSFLVDGKYLTSPSMTGGTENAFKVINELIAQITASKTVTTPTAP
jgi:thiol:disulfide interchange protein DsbA